MSSWARAFFPWGMVNHRKTIEEAQKIIDSLEIDLSAQEAVENLSVAEQQFVKIVRALAFEPQVLIMDEPTAVFNVKDAQIVLNLARSISKKRHRDNIYLPLSGGNHRFS